MDGAGYCLHRERMGGPGSSGIGRPVKVTGRMKSATGGKMADRSRSGCTESARGGGWTQRGPIRVATGDSRKCLSRELAGDELTTAMSVPGSMERADGKNRPAVRVETAPECEMGNGGTLERAELSCRERGQGPVEGRNCEPAATASG